MPTTIVDFGCGDGRDSIAFAAAGCRVLGLDLSEAGLDHARARAVESGTDADSGSSAATSTTPMRSIDALVGVRRADEPVLFYGRFLLHALFEETQQNVLNVIEAVARSGRRAGAGVSRPRRRKPSQALIGSDSRRFVDGSDVAARLVEHGYVLHHEQGTGFAPYGDVRTRGSTGSSLDT